MRHHQRLGVYFTIFVNLVVFLLLLALDVVFDLKLKKILKYGGYIPHPPVSAPLDIITNQDNQIFFPASS